MSERLTILNVDDQDAPRYIKTRDLRAAGFDVREARNGTDALRLVEQLEPPIVLLDVHMPDISGYEVCRIIKQRWPGTMVLMTSATFTSSADRTVGLDSGADSFLVQPAEPLELGAAVNALVRIRRSEDALRSLNDTLEQRVKDRVADLAEANARLTSEIEQRQKAEATLVQAAKMQAVGQLTGGLAHDFNNLLTAVVGNLDLIRSRSTDARMQRLAENAFKAAERGSKLTAQLLAFSRTQRIATAPIDVNALIAGTHDLLKQSLGPNIAIELKLDPTGPIATADANQLELAILNLAINARDSMPEGGKLAIETAPSSVSADFVTIAVSDTGTGMPPDVAARAFDPFYTTKPAGKGTGLGLSQVYGIAKQFGGDVALRSEVGEGTTVILHLPRAQGGVAANASGEASPSGATNSEKVLIVDDDPDVREVVTGFLSDLGYEVVEAHHGQEALAILRGFPADIVVVDFAMPGMNGAETALALRQHQPEVPILFVSGFADTQALEQAIGDAPLLHKPFRPAELAAAIRSILDARPLPKA